MRLQVECYADRIADERPIRFRLGDHEYMVEEVLDQWYEWVTTPSHTVLP